MDKEIRSGCNKTSINIIVSFQVTVSTQTGHESPDMAFNAEKMTMDKHCYECKVRYRDPKPQDLVMYLHAWKYKVSAAHTRTDLLFTVPATQRQSTGLLGAAPD